MPLIHSKSISLLSQPSFQNNITFYQPLGNGDGTVLSTSTYSLSLSSDQYGRKKRSTIIDTTNKHVSHKNANSNKKSDNSLGRSGSIHSQPQQLRRAKSTSSMRTSRNDPFLKHKKGYRDTFKPIAEEESASSQKEIIEYETSEVPSPKIDPYQMARLEMQKMQNVQTLKRKQKSKKESHKKMSQNVTDDVPMSKFTIRNRKSEKRGKNLETKNSEKSKSSINTRVKNRAGPLVFSVSFDDDTISVLNKMLEHENDNLAVKNVPQYEIPIPVEYKVMNRSVLEPIPELDRFSFED